MSSPFASGPNPYASPVPPPAPLPVLPVGPAQTSMDYMRSYGFIFENPDWMTTALLLALVWIVAFVPAIGIIVNLLILGYQFEVIDALLKTQGRQYPTFDFGRIGDYLTRGVWPFLVYLVTMLVSVMVLYGGMIVGVLVVAGIASAAGDDLGPVLGFILGGAGILFFFAALVVVMIYVAAMVLRSGLAQDFASAFQFAWINDFVRRMWPELLLSGLFLYVTAFVLEILGMLALCIGLFFALALITLAFAHILYQLYVVYLSRGGMPVAPKMAFAQPMTTPPAYPPKPLA
jgi:hypothetical protein